METRFGAILGACTLQGRFSARPTLRLPPVRSGRGDRSTSGGQRTGSGAWRAARTPSQSGAAVCVRQVLSEDGSRREDHPNLRAPAEGRPAPRAHRHAGPSRHGSWHPSGRAQGGRRRLPGDAGQAASSANTKPSWCRPTGGRQRPTPDHRMLSSEIALLQSDLLATAGPRGRVTAKLGWMLRPAQKITPHLHGGQGLRLGAQSAMPFWIVGSAGSRDHPVVCPTMSRPATIHRDIETLGLDRQAATVASPSPTGSLDSDKPSTASSRSTVSRVDGIPSMSVSGKRGGRCHCRATRAYRDQERPVGSGPAHTSMARIERRWLTPSPPHRSPLRDRLSRGGGWREHHRDDRSADRDLRQRGYRSDDETAIAATNVDLHVPSGCRDAWIDDHTWVDGGTTSRRSGRRVIVHRQLLGTRPGRPRTHLDSIPTRCAATPNSAPRPGAGRDPHRARCRLPGQSRPRAGDGDVGHRRPGSFPEPVQGHPMERGRTGLATSAAISAKNYAPGAGSPKARPGRAHTDAPSGRPVV